MNDDYELEEEDDEEDDDEVNLADTEVLQLDLNVPEASALAPVIPLHPDNQAPVSGDGGGDTPPPEEGAGDGSDDGNELPAEEVAVIGESIPWWPLFVGAGFVLASVWIGRAKQQ